MTEQEGIITVYCLGPLRVWCGDREIRAADWRKTKAMNLFKFLLAHRTTWVPVEEILDGLWPDMDGECGLNNFRVTLHHARQALGAAVLPGTADGFAIQYLHRRCRLNPALMGWVDADRFSSLVQEGWRLVADRRPQEGAECFARADALYQGEFVADDPYSDWLQPERERLRGMELETLEWLVGYWTQVGECVQGIRWAHRLLALDPYREDIHRQLMVNLERAGRPGEALAHYRLCERLFSTQLGMRVSVQTTRLYQAIAAASSC
ncbi:MAG TPA: hypothetical protein GX513_10440 [Firmicutes bacterium]|nr:hypothetical protein [Bacillota bacterium]